MCRRRLNFSEMLACAAVPLTSGLCVQLAVVGIQLVLTYWRPEWRGDSQQASEPDHSSLTGVRNQFLNPRWSLGSCDMVLLGQQAFQFCGCCCCHRYWRCCDAHVSARD